MGRIPFAYRDITDYLYPDGTAEGHLERAIAIVAVHPDVGERERYAAWVAVRVCPDDMSMSECLVRVGGAVERRHLGLVERAVALEEWRRDGKSGMV